MMRERGRGRKVMGPTHRPRVVLAAAALSLVMASGPAAACAQDAGEWPVHSEDRPRPTVVDPGPAGESVPPPSDAVVLFDGSDLEAWEGPGGADPGWHIVDGVLEVVGGTGSLTTGREFGDIQLHVEWASPVPAEGEGQGRGNSGVFLMGLYEIQVLDSYRNDTYPDGQAAALYGQHPPLVNASRPPGEWQSFDIVFRAPRFGADGSLERPAHATVFHNGVLVHDAAEFHGQTAHGRPAEYEAHPARGPIMLQDHTNPVRFRAIWVRELD